MYERILVPLDGSELAEGVLPYVQELAKRFESGVVLLQAVAPLVQLMGQAASPEAPPVTTEATMKAAKLQHDAMVSSARDYLASVAGQLGRAEISVQVEVVEGAATAAILDYVKTHDMSLIAMSTHGRGGLGRLVFGSVADDVLRNSHLPVLLIRPGD